MDVDLVDHPSSINQSEDEDFRVDENGISKFQNRACVPDVSELKLTILEESHKNSLSIHLGATKMYQDLKKMFWWPRMKRKFVRLVYAYLTCQKSKIKHHNSFGLMQQLDILE